MIEKAKDLGVFCVPRNLVFDVEGDPSYAIQNPTQERECLFSVHIIQDQRDETLKDHILFSIPNMLLS